MDDTTKADATEQPAPLKRYDYYKGPQRLGDLWTLSRGSLTMRCALSTNKVGWELRLTAGSNYARTEICRTETDVRSTSAAWAAEARAKGWT